MNLFAAGLFFLFSFSFFLLKKRSFF